MIIPPNRNFLTAGEYHRIVPRTLNPDTPTDDLLELAILGAGGEAGEIIDLYKKHKFHGHPLDLDKLDSEFGDLLWYIAVYAQWRCISILNLMYINAKKLAARYPNGFTTDRSLNRDTRTDEQDHRP